jgi:hypothetical protein
MTGVAITVVGYGGWYPAGVARLVEKFREVDSGRTVMAWVNALPPGAPRYVIKDGYDYTAYCAKPFALRAARDAGAEIGIQLDAAFWPIRPIDKFADYIYEKGYYLCENGFPMGEWCSDAALGTFGLTRDEALAIPEASSYAVGLDFRKQTSNRALDEWCAMALDGKTFPGPHTQTGGSGRNQGHVSSDPRVRGHRHDQTALSAITWKLGMREHVKRPQFTAYEAGYGGFPDETTVLVNRGGL